MNSGNKSNNLNKIAFVGSSPFVSPNLSSFILNALLGSSVDGNAHSLNLGLGEVYYFSNFRYEEKLPIKTKKDPINYFHIHRLPLMIDIHNFDLIVYFIENNAESYLYNCFSDSYPGLVILQDASLLKVELSSLFHATDPIGIDGKLKSYYPGSNVSLGKQHVLGRSIDIYSGVYDFLECLKSKLPVIVLENRLANLVQESLPSCECVPLHTYFKKQSESNKKNNNKNFLNLIILNSPFSVLSKEIRLLAGHENYRKIDYPVYLLLDSEEGRQETVRELSPPELDQGLIDRLDSIILTDLNHFQGIPSLIYYALLAGIKMSLPELVREEFGPMEGIIYHNRLGSYKDIILSLEKSDGSPELKLSSGFVENLIQKFISTSPDFKLLLREKSRLRKDKLFSRLKVIAREHQGGVVALNVETHSLENKKDFKELFNYEGD